MICKYCGQKFNNRDIGECHLKACKDDPRNKGIEDYELYKRAQQHRFRPERAAHHSGSERKENFLNIIKSKIGISGRTLSIGCANSEEIKLLHGIGFQEVIGIDLVPNFSDIIEMDMHSLNFATESFDFILMSHSLEHTYDFEKVIQECDKVLKIEGYMAFEVPVNYRVNDVDRIDFKNAESLFIEIGKYINCISIYGVDIKYGERNNFCATDVARLIIQKVGD